MKIETKDTEGRVNGWLCPVWSALDNPELRPDQVYLTAIAPHTRKGPHLHKVRRGCFMVISGSVTIWSRRRDGKYSESTGERLTVVPPGWACALYNHGDTEALVLNLPSPAWSKEQPDEWPVVDWKDPEGWINGK